MKKLLLLVKAIFQFFEYPLFCTLFYLKQISYLVFFTTAYPEKSVVGENMAYSFLSYVS